MRGKTVVCCLAVAIVTLCLFPRAMAVEDFEDMEVWEKLTVLESPTWGERKNTERRFKFPLKKFDTYCAKNGGASPGNMLVFVHGLLKDAGLGGEESLLMWANTAHRMMSEVYANSRAAKMATPQCSEILAMYVAARRDTGQSPREARRGIVEVVKVLQGLAKK